MRTPLRTLSKVISRFSPSRLYTDSHWSASVLLLSLIWKMGKVLKIFSMARKVKKKQERKKFLRTGSSLSERRNERRDRKDRRILTSLILHPEMASFPENSHKIQLLPSSYQKSDVKYSYKNGLGDKDTENLKATITSSFKNLLSVLFLFTEKLN